MKTTKKITAVLLMILVLFTCIPMDVFATELYSTEEDLSYSSNNIIGDTIVNAIDDTSQEFNDNGGYGIFGLALSNLTANVSLSAPDHSTLLVAIYDEDTNYMVTSGKVSVNSDTQTVEVALAECVLPNYYIIKAFILNSDNSPVCNHYENKEYTKAYEAFFAKDVFDFDEEKVINFDAGYETNFAVVHDDSVVVNCSENENIVVTDDYENGIYVFENANEEITSLVYGDILYYVYGYGEEEYILTKVGTVETNGDLTTVTAADECEMSELFAYIDIDSSKLETPQIYRAEFDDDGGQLNEEKSYPITSGSKAKEFKGNNYSLKLSVSGDITFHIKFHYDFKIWGKDYYLFEYWVGVNANANATFNASGSFTKKCTMINTDIPIFYGIDVHVEVNLTISASASIEIKGDINFTMKNGASRESGGVQKKIEQKPTVEFNLDISGKYSISVTPELVIGFKIVKVFAVDMSVPVAVSTSGTLYVPTSNEDLQKHSCKICVAGTSDVTIKLNITVKFLTKNIITVTPASKKIPLGDYYISLNNGIKFGWGSCPKITGDGSGSGGGTGDNTGNAGGNTGGGNGSGGNTSFWEEEIIKDITGTCGKNLSWTLYTDGELVISGNGEMPDFKYYFQAPWHEYSSRVKSVVIGKGVKNIGAYAFYNYKKLTSVKFMGPTSEIGDYAFYGCMALTSVTLPVGLKKIGEEAFVNACNLRNIEFPDGIQEIGDGAFFYCSSLSGTINVPASVVSLDNFVYTNISEIIVDPRNQFYCNDEHGALFNKDKTTLIRYPSGNGTDKYVVPDTVVTIGHSAFNWVNITDLILPNSVINIEDNAFSEANIETVYYEGSESEWDNIIISEYTKGQLASCDIVYNYTPEGSIEPPEENIENIANFSMARSVLNSSSNRETTTKSKVVTPAIKDYGYLMVVVKDVNADDLLASDNLLFVDQKVATVTTLDFEYTIPVDIESHSVIIYFADLITQNHKHNYNVTERETSCTQDGGIVYACECGYTYMENIIEAAGHNYTITSTEPTCTQKGSQTYTCVVCGGSHTDEVSALGHDLSSFIQIKAPTCTEKGVETAECSRCDYFETKDIPANKHNYKAVVIPATCHSSGYTTNTCVVCGDSYTSNPTNVIPHTIGDWYVMTPAGCESTGTKQRNCSECDYSETQEIPATGHDFDGSVCKNCDYDKADTCSCKCHKSGIAKIIFKIILIFQKIFKKNRICEGCGVYHY